MPDCHLQDICLLQLGLLLRDGSRCEAGFQVGVKHARAWVGADTHVQLESSDHGFLQLIQTVVDPLPPLPLDEWFPHL